MRINDSRSLSIEIKHIFKINKLREIEQKIYSLLRQSKFDGLQSTLLPFIDVTNYDKQDNEKIIAILYDEISKVFTHCKKLIVNSPFTKSIITNLFLLLKEIEMIEYYLKVLIHPNEEQQTKKEYQNTLGIFRWQNGINIDIENPIILKRNNQKLISFDLTVSDDVRFLEGDEIIINRERLLTDNPKRVNLLNNMQKLSHVFKEKSNTDVLQLEIRNNKRIIIKRKIPIENKTNEESNLSDIYNKDDSSESDIVDEDNAIELLLNYDDKERIIELEIRNLLININDVDLNFSYSIIDLMGANATYQISKSIEIITDLPVNSFNIPPIIINKINQISNSEDNINHLILRVDLYINNFMYTSLILPNNLLIKLLNNNLFWRE